MIPYGTIFSDAFDMTYPGGKSSAGVYQKIINLMPPHEVYIEPFLGGDTHETAAWVNIGMDLAQHVDLDRDVVDGWRASAAMLGCRTRPGRSQSQPIGYPQASDFGPISGGTTRIS